MNVCRSCGKKFRGDYCPKCGTRYVPLVVCKNCGTSFAGKFCPECGTPYGGTEPPDMPVYDEALPLDFSSEDLDETGSAGLDYLLRDGTYVVSGPGSCKDADVVIPSGRDGRPVTGIARMAFTESKIKSVVIPDTVAMISEMAFSKCRSLTKVSVGKNVEIIEPMAFAGCRSLTDINLPEGLKQIELSTFMCCYSLAEPVIPIGVTVIGKSAFSGCSKIKRVIIPAGVTEIGEEAFFTCTAMKSVVIPVSVSVIDKRAFYSTALRIIYYHGAQEDWDRVSIGWGNFPVTKATKYYYSEKKPTKKGNFWHEDADGNPVMW